MSQFPPSQICQIYLRGLFYDLFSSCQLSKAIHEAFSLMHFHVIMVINNRRIWRITLHSCQLYLKTHNHFLSFIYGINMFHANYPHPSAICPSQLLAGQMRCPGPFQSKKCHLDTLNMFWCFLKEHHSPLYLGYLLKLTPVSWPDIEFFAEGRGTHFK